MLNLLFNNKKLPNWLKVTNIREPIANYEKKQIIVEGYFRKKHLLELRKKIELNSFMAGGLKGYGRLILPANPTVHYVAKVKEFNNTSQSYSKERWTMTFELESDFIINNMEKKAVFRENIELVNAGTVDVYPLLKFNVVSSCQRIRILNDAGNEIIINGNFRERQVITFNQEIFKIELDGLLEMNILQLNSKRLKLRVGSNKWRVAEGNVSVSVVWSEKYT